MTSVRRRNVTPRSCGRRMDVHARHSARSAMVARRVIQVRAGEIPCVGGHSLPQQRESPNQIRTCPSRTRPRYPQRRLCSNARDRGRQLRLRICRPPIPTMRNSCCCHHLRRCLHDVLNPIMRAQRSAKSFCKAGQC